MRGRVPGICGASPCPRGIFDYAVQMRTVAGPTHPSCRVVSPHGRDRAPRNLRSQTELGSQRYDGERSSGTHRTAHPLRCCSLAGVRGEGFRHRYLGRTGDNSDAAAVRCLRVDSPGMRANTPGQPRATADKANARVVEVRHRFLLSNDGIAVISGRAGGGCGG